MTNKIPDGFFYTFGGKRYRVTVSDDETGETLYSRLSDGGVLCTVERHEILKASGEVEGTQQHFYWGSPALILHAFMQIETKLRELMTSNDAFVRGAKEPFL